MLLTLVISTVVVGQGSLPTRQLTNLNFRRLGPTNPTMYQGAFPGDWTASSVADFDQFVSFSGARVFTHRLPSTHPRGGRMLRVVTDFGYNPSVFYGGGIAQSGLMKPGTVFEYDLFVVRDSVTGGPVRLNGQFLDPTRHVPTGDWKRVRVNLNETCGGIAWEWSDEHGGTADFYITNIRYLPSLGVR